MMEYVEDRIVKRTIYNNNFITQPLHMFWGSVVEIQ
jgi:hypothetical protein